MVLQCFSLNQLFCTQRSNNYRPNSKKVKNYFLSEISIVFVANPCIQIWLKLLGRRNDLVFHDIDIGARVLQYQKLLDY